MVWEVGGARDPHSAPGSASNLLPDLRELGETVQGNLGSPFGSKMRVKHRGQPTARCLLPISIVGVEGRMLAGPGSKLSPSLTSLGLLGALRVQGSSLLAPGRRERRLTGES